MKNLILATSASIALASFSGVATAGCDSTTRIDSVSALTTLLRNNTVCVPGATPANWEWQEFHSSRGDLVDYKKGPTDKVDPTEKVGTWAVTKDNSGLAIVTHTYGAQQYPFSVHRNGNNSYSFCGGTPPDIKATIKTSQGACP